MTSGPKSISVVTTLPPAYCQPFAKAPLGAYRRLSKPHEIRARTASRRRPRLDHGRAGPQAYSLSGSDQNLAELGVLHEVNHGGLSTWYEDCHVTLRPLLEKQGLAK